MNERPICQHCGMPCVDPWEHRDRYEHDPEFKDEHGDTYRFDTATGKGVFVEGAAA